MKRFSILAAVCLGVVSVHLRAAGPDDRYVEIYSLIQQADQTNSAGQKERAHELYDQAFKELKQLEAANPNWNETVVRFRLKYLDRKLAETNSQPAPAPEPAAPLAETPLAKDQQIQALQGQIQLLNAKLKEAWAARPAAVDPQELAKAQEQIKSLEKERDLLKVSLEQAQDNTGKGANERLQKAEASLEQANARLKEQAETVAALQREKELLGNRVNELMTQLAAGKVAAEVKADLERQVEQLRNAQKSGPGDELADQLAMAQAEARTAQARVGELEKTIQSLRQELASAKGTAPAPDESKVRELEKERDDLAARLAEATRKLTESGSGADRTQFEYLTNQLATLRARLQVYEAKKAPYTREELALMKQPQAKPVEAKPEVPQDSPRSLPAGAVALANEAERAFRSGRYEDAERNYLQILKLDPDNVFILHSLAATQFNLKEYDKVEANLKRALELAPSDAASLSLMGILKISQEKNDEALDALSRAAQLDPTDAETQNYLGVVLSQKGQRDAAEAALRKAVQLAPNYAAAHHNLAVVYATQQPPFLELARWHYQKALSAHEAPSPELERLLEGKGNPSP